MSHKRDIAVVNVDGRAVRLPPRLNMSDATADPARMAARILDLVVPSFADAAGAYAFEQLLGNGGSVGPTGDPAQAGLTVRRLAARSTIDSQPAFGTTFPAGEVVTVTADSPSASCVRDGAPTVFAQFGGGTIRRISPAARAVLNRYASFLAAPIVARGTALGVLLLARGPDAPPFCGADTQAAAYLGARAGAAIADALAQMRHRSVAEAVRPPRSAITRVTPGRLEIAGRCLPAAGCDVCGDWYDIVPLPRGRTGLIAGDVMGHGPEAAAVMTRMSATAYILADLDLPPTEVLRQLNRAALALPQDTLVTCAYAVIDPVGQSCTIATAGHLPPVLALPDGSTRVPGIPSGQSLGVAPAGYGEARIKLRPRTVLALYTDGLVETRARPFDKGILALRSELARQHRDLDATCERLIAALGEAREDDITVVLARLRPESDAA